MDDQVRRVIDALKGFAEGEFSADDWIAWWDDNSGAVAAAVKRGQFLRLKPSINWDTVHNVARSHAEACKVLDARKISFVKSQRYERELRALEELQAPQEEFFGEVLYYVETRLRASYNQMFLDRMWQLYQDDGAPEDVRRWMSKRVKPEFKCVEKRPQWVRDPEWPIHEGRPAIFITQYALPENDVTKSSYTWGGTIYVFGYRVNQSKDSFEIENVVIVQQPGT